MEDKVNLEAKYYLNLKQLAKICAVSECTLRVVLSRAELARYAVVRREEYITGTGE